MENQQSETQLSPKKGILRRFLRFPGVVKSVVILIVLVLAILILTNPSMGQFKEFIPSTINDNKIVWKKMKLSRKRNWLLFSIYEYQYDFHYEREYWAVFNNFFKK